MKIKQLIKFYNNNILFLNICINLYNNTKNNDFL